MTTPDWARRLGIGLGALLVLAGIAETVRLIVTGDGGLLFWFGTLSGGGALILVGTLGLSSRPAVARRLVVAGALLGLVPTMWTIVAPVLLLALITLVLKDRPVQ